MLEAAEQAGVQVDLGPVPLRLARLHRPGCRRLPRALHRLRACSARGATVGQRTAADRLPLERDQLHIVGGGGRIFPAASGPMSVGWFKRQLVKAGNDGSQRRSSGIGPTRSMMWAEPLIHIAPHDHAARPSRKPNRTAEACSRPTTGSWAVPSRSSAAIRRFVDLVGWNYLSAQPMVLGGSDHPDGPSRIPAACRHADRNGGTLRVSRSSFPKRAPRGRASRRGCTMSAVRSATR